MVIEDCAQAQGSKYKGRHVGTCGHFGCYSFDIAKLMPAGEGGMLVFDGEGPAGATGSTASAATRAPRSTQIKEGRQH